MHNRRQQARCLDITRLISRVGRGTWTGIDRVEAAYFAACLSDEMPFFALVRIARGFALLDRDGAGEMFTRLKGKTPLGPADFRARLRPVMNPARQQAESDLRRFSIARTNRSGLARMLARHLPDGCAWLNVGHTNLDPSVFDSVHALPGGRAHIMVHDMIPLDFPAYQRPGMPERFETAMRVVAGNADRVIYNSEQTRRGAEHRFRTWGRIPEGLVAHLGIDTSVPDTDLVDTPIDRNRPYFTVTGTIEPRKNHALLLDVWEEIAAKTHPNQRPQLVLIGARGWNNAAVFERLDTSPLVGRDIHELGPVSDAEALPVLKGARAALFPSLAEGFGLPVGEAIALNVPVIANDLPVLREIYGNIPVYARAADMYSWRKTITDLTGNEEVEQSSKARADLTATLPSWQDHFNLVLSVT